MNNKMVLLGVDAAVAAGLMALLVAVIGLDALLTHLYPNAAASSQNAPGEQPIKKTVSSKKIRLGVTLPHVDQMGIWDDVGTLLDSMGDGYKYDLVNEGDLNDLAKLKQFDVLFCSCSASKSPPAVAETLKAYVSQGGTLYASDWRYDVVAAAFPEVRDRNLEGPGKDNLVNADVIDPGLRDIFGQKVELTFDMDTWKPAAFSGDRVKVLLKGRYTDRFNGQIRTAPLLVKFTYGKGNVIFTSYHHGKNNSELEKKLLKYLVYSLVTAKLQSEIEITQLNSQFSPAKSNLFSASKSDPSVSYKYHSSHASKLRFDLGFSGEGAELKLTVKSPSGKNYEQKGTSSFAIEANGEVGDWTYTVTALRVPHENFAFVVTVAQGKK
jgi:hypothetical protein